MSRKKQSFTDYIEDCVRDFGQFVDRNWDHLDPSRVFVGALVVFVILGFMIVSSSYGAYYFMYFLHRLSVYAQGIPVVSFIFSFTDPPGPKFLEGALVGSAFTCFIFMFIMSRFE